MNQVNIIIMCAVEMENANYQHKNNHTKSLLEN